MFTFTCREMKKPSLTRITFVIDDIGFTVAYTIIITCNTNWSISITITSFENRISKFISSLMKVALMLAPYKISIALFTVTCWKVKETILAHVTFVINEIRFTTAYSIVITWSTIWPMSVTITSFEIKITTISHCIT